MIDSLLSAVLISVLGTANFPDPNIITPQNEMQIEFEQRAQYALTWLSGDQVETYIRLGKPAFIEKVDVPRDDLHQGYTQGKPPEPDIVEERWWYPDLSKPLTFQPDKTGDYKLLRQPDQLVIFASQVQPKINYDFNYGKELLHCNYASEVYNLKDCPDSVELSLYLIIPPQGLDTSYTWKVAIQDREGRVVCRDSSSDGVLQPDGSIIDQMSIILAKDYFESRTNTLTARYYSLTTQVESGDKGSLQIWK